MKKRNRDWLDPRWQKFRLERLSISDWCCDQCDSKEDTLHVHHPFYISGRKPWQYPLEITQVLCDECHEIAHEFSADYETLGPEIWEKLLEKIFGWTRAMGRRALTDIDESINREFAPEP